MIDLSRTVIPKSDQTNADDLIAGPRTITVTAVKMLSSEEQPVGISYEGDDGKPYKPCKSMRRVLIAAWGADGAQYVGRSMTIYLDRAVTWGGAEVGGIRISHLSHIGRRMTMALTATKKSRKAYVVDPLVVADNPAPSDPSDQFIKEWLSDIAAAETIADLRVVFGAAYKAGRSKDEKTAFKAAYDARTIKLTTQEQSA